MLLGEFFKLDIKGLFQEFKQFFFITYVDASRPVCPFPIHLFSIAFIRSFNPSDPCGIIAFFRVVRMRKGMLADQILRLEIFPQIEKVLYRYGRIDDKTYANISMSV